jgi:dihydropteroate synthase
MRPLVMGVVNVTPDSFSDGGRYLSHDAAVAHGLRLVAEGADVVDVGGESTRPGAEPVDPDEEQRRVLHVVGALREHVRVSIDTRNAETAVLAVAAGASLLNDVSASLAPLAADLGVGWVAMHLPGDPRTMQDDPRYHDVVREVRTYLLAKAEEARALGVDEVWVDPGFGFGKTTAHNLDLLANLDEITGAGLPVVVGLSRKRTMGVLTAASDRRAAIPPLPGLDGPPTLDDDLVPTPVDDRVEASVTAAVWAVARGAAMVRVHDVAPTVAALRARAEGWEEPW